MSRLVDRYYDRALAVDGLSPAILERQELERLKGQLLVVRHALAMPRRIGGDATSAELARDKKIARRVAHVISQCLRVWGCMSDDIGEPKAEHRRIGATIDWESWVASQEQWIAQRLPLYATVGKKKNRVPWANACLTRLQNEAHWLRWSLR